MKINAQIVVIAGIAGLLQGCLTYQPGKPPAVFPEGEKTSSAPVPAAVSKPAPVREPAPPTPVKEPILNVVAETTRAPAGELLVRGLSVDQNTIEILTTGQIKDYKLLTLSEPSRLVIDITGALSGFKQKSIQIDKLGIATARFESHPEYLRIFLDAAQWRIIPYRIEETGTSLKIIITSP